MKRVVIAGKCQHQGNRIHSKILKRVYFGEGEL